MKRLSPAALVAAQLGRLVELLEVLVCAQLAPSTTRSYSSTPEARRQRRHRRTGEFSERDMSREDHAPMALRHSVTGRDLGVTNVTAGPALQFPPSSVTEKKLQSKAAAPPRLPKSFFAQLYRRMHEVRLELLGKPYRADKIEQHNATLLLHQVGDVAAAISAVNLFAQLWRQDEHTRRRRTVSISSVLHTLGRIVRVRRAGKWTLRVIAKDDLELQQRAKERRRELYGERAPAAASTTPPAPAPLEPTLPRGPDQVRKILQELQSRGVVRVRKVGT